MASSEPAIHTKNNIGATPLTILVMGMVLVIFLYPHVFLLWQDSDARAQAFSALVMGQFKLFTTGLSIALLAFLVLKMVLDVKPNRALLYQLWWLLIIASFGAVNLDIYTVFSLSQKIGFLFSDGLIGYWHHTLNQYAALWISTWLVIAIGVLTESNYKALFGYAFIKRWGNIITLFIPLGYMVLPLILCGKSHTSLMIPEIHRSLFTLQLIWMIQSFGLIIVLMLGLKQGEFNRGFVSQQIKCILVVAGFLFAAEMIVWAKYALALSHRDIWPYHEAPSWGQKFYSFIMLAWPLILLMFACYGLWRYHHSKSKLGEDEEKVSNDFGSARFASRDDLKKLNFYDETIGPLLGKDEEGNNLYTPLTNKLVISPPGGGKTTSSSIPLLLKHKGPVFVFDVKGELWAVTAEHRHNSMGREIVTIDPFKITQQRSFAKGKSRDLLKEYHINPFEWLPKTPQALDRVINSFAASFLINSDRHTSHSSHFDENAKILIRGYIDYLVRSEIENKSLPELFRLLSSSFEDNKETTKMMLAIGGRAAEAAKQIGRVGANERGSILSTTYRQLDWLGDSNVSRILNKSNFKLKDYLKGNMDIYVIVPEDQIKEHGRLMRMMMALLMGQIIQADPRDLPDKKMVFLLEELAQMGNYPDVEQCIEVLRARNVVVWSVFQTLSQIELFEKPDLFKSAALKQIFTTDDVKTMEWVQALAGKKTILTKGKSEDKGKSRQSSQWLSGTTSTSQGESIHETGVELLPINEIREMDEDTQLAFYKGMPVIRCKKARYFEDKKLRELAASNPLAGC